MTERPAAGIHQTILIVAVAVSAVIGSVAGAVTAVLMTGAINASDLFGRFSLNANGLPVDKNIVRLIEEESATISVVDTVAPSVVSVVIQKTRGELAREREFSEYFDPFFDERSNELTPAESAELVDVGGGSGFFVSADGYIVTNRHVVSDKDAVYVVVTNDGAELPARVAAVDAYLDVAVLDVEGEGYPTVTFADSDAIRIGETVIAIGNTLSEYRNTVTKGVVSGINRRVVAGDEGGMDEVIEHAIQTDAAINPGNSGGPLINLLGEVMGINTAVSYDGQSVGFALPINDVKKIVDDVAQYGRIVRPWLGVRYLPVDAELAEERSLPFAYGALLEDGNGAATEPAVVPDSPAADAELRAGDVILSVNGTNLTEDMSLGSLIGDFDPGETIVLRVVRGEEQFDVEVVLEELVGD